MKCTANTPSQLGFWPSSLAGQQVAVQPLLSHPLQHAPVVAVVVVVVLFVVVLPILALLPWLCWLQHSSSSEGTQPEHHLCPLRSTAGEQKVVQLLYSRRTESGTAALHQQNRTVVQLLYTSRTEQCYSCSTPGEQNSVTAALQQENRTVLQLLYSCT